MMDLKSHVYSQWIRDIRAWLETQPGATEFDGSPLDGILRVMRHKDERLAAAEAAARWLWPKVSDDAYDAAWEKWPWLDSESAKGWWDE